jgi:aspartokinase-like uncharacterized kinase
VSRLVVFKVGGSLLDWPELPARLAEVLAAYRQDRVALVVGGGTAADVVRSFDRIHGLGELRAHDLAMRSLDLTAHLLATLVDGLVVVERSGELRSAWDGGRVPVLLPRTILAEVETRASRPLPHSWELTSDSIAAVIAVHLGAAELVLLKSAPLPPDVDPREAGRLGLVDPCFAEAVRPLRRVSYRCLREPGGDR